MALTEAQLKARDGKVTAGFAPYLMAGKEDRILSEWMRLVGHPALEEPDWGARWDLNYGSVIEPLALDWHEKKTGMALICRGDVVVHPDMPHVCATLDAFRAEDDAVIDCKAWSSWQKLDYIRSFLTPQIIVQRACKKASLGAILLVHGGTEPVEYPITWTPDYEAEVWDRIAQFWKCVCDLTPPVALPAKMAAIPAVTKYDMAKSNRWADQAADWLVTYKHARSCEIAAKELKKLVPPDAVECAGHGVICTRDRAGRLSLRAIATEATA